MPDEPAEEMTVDDVVAWAFDRFVADDLAALD